VAISLNHSCRRNATMFSLGIVVNINVAANNKNCKVLSYKRNNGFPLHRCRATKCLAMLSTIQKYRGLQVRCPILSSSFKQICKFSTDFRKSPQYQISVGSAQWKPRSYMRTDRRTDMTSRIRVFLYLCERA
jgi:hypothetical protein